MDPRSIWKVLGVYWANYLSLFSLSRVGKLLSVQPFSGQIDGGSGGSKIVVRSEF